jgi:hypothetical protein
MTLARLKKDIKFEEDPEINDLLEDVRGINGNITAWWGGGKEVEIMFGFLWIKKLSLKYLDIICPKCKCGIWKDKKCNKCGFRVN